MAALPPFDATSKDSKLDRITVQQWAGRLCYFLPQSPKLKAGGSRLVALSRRQKALICTCVLILEGRREYSFRTLDVLVSLRHSRQMQWASAGSSLALPWLAVPHPDVPAG